MTLQRQLLWTLLLQGGGGVALLVSTIWLGKALGPAQQGQFNQLKSVIEFGATLASFGMPQALYVHAQTGQLRLPAARRLAAWVAVLGLPVGAGLALAGSLNSPLQLLAPLALAVAFGALHLQWRALTLLADATWRFNVVTLLPQLLLLPLAAAAVVLGGLSAPQLAWGMGASFLAAAFVAGRMLSATPAMKQPAAAAAPTLQPVQFKRLFQHGAATWLAASLGTLAVVLLQHAAQAREGPAALGVISLALLVSQVPLTPLNYALPLLLRHRLRGTPQARVAMRAASLLPVLPMLMLAALAWCLGRWRSDLWMGAGYEGLSLLVAWLLVAAGAEAATRLALVHAQAEGRPSRAALTEAVRVAVLLVGAFGGLNLGAASGLLALAMWWAVAAWLALATLWCLSRSGGPPQTGNS